MATCPSRLPGLQSQAPTPHPKQPGPQSQPFVELSKHALALRLRLWLLWTDLCPALSPRAGALLLTARAVEWAFERSPGLDEVMRGALTMGLVLLREGTRELALPPSARGHSQKAAVGKPGSKPSPDQPCRLPDPGRPPPTPRERNVCCWSHQNAPRRCPTQLEKGTPPPTDRSKRVHPGLKDNLGKLRPS